jgi:hypothetical protein
MQFDQMKRREFGPSARENGIQERMLEALDDSLGLLHN